MQRTIWCLWEPPGRLPGYLRACLRTIERSAGVPVRLLDAADVEALAPSMRPELAERIIDIGQRSDYYRSHLLAAQGGVWLDIDIIVFRNLGFLFDLLEHHELVSRRRVAGNASTNLLGARAGSPIMLRWIERQEEIVERLAPGEELPWTALGATALNEAIGEADVHLLPSHVVAPVPWTQSDQFISRFGDVRTALEQDPVTVMLYNARFPDWLRSATEDEVLASPLLVSRLLRIALGMSSVDDERRWIDPFGRVVESLGRTVSRGLARARRGASPS